MVRHGEALVPDLAIIPAYNEAETLPFVLSGLREREGRGRPPLDVVVVDDGSADGTAEVATSHGATVLRLPFNLGLGGAMRAGFRYAVENGYDRAVQLDADGQHDPLAIDDLLSELEHADLVIGSRFADDISSYEVGRTRRRAMVVLQLLIRMLTGRTFTDTSSGFRAFNRPVLQFFARSYPTEYMESVEALLAASYAGFRITEVPVRMQQRAGGSPSNRRSKLAYHYVRVLVSLLANASRQRPTAALPARGEPGT